MSHFNSTAPPWNDIPPLDGCGIAVPTQTGAVSVATTAGQLVISMHNFGARLRFGECQFGDYGMLIKEPPAVIPVVTNGENLTIIEGGGHTLTLHHQPLSFELLKDSQYIQQSPTDSHSVSQFRLPPVARVDQGWFISLELESSEPLYGLGEKWGSLNKRVQLISSYNEDALDVNGEASYKNTPFAWSPNGWGAFVHTPAPVTHGVGFAPWSQRAYSMLVAPCLKPGGEVECYLPHLNNSHWCKFPSGEPFESGRTHQLTLSLNDIAVFVPEATQIPLGPDVAYTNALTSGSLVASSWPN